MTSAPRDHWPRKTEEKNEILEKAMKKAFAAGFSASCRRDGEDDHMPEPESYWIFDERGPEKVKKAPKKASPKKPSPDPGLADLPHDHSKCRARWYNKGHGAQCWRDPTEDGDLCTQCQERLDDDSKDFWGYFDEPLEDCNLNKDGKPHSWKKLATSRAEKKSSDKEEQLAKKEKDKEEQLAKKEKDKEAKKAAKSEKKKKLKKAAKAEKKKAEDETIEDPIEEDPIEEEEKVEEKVEEEKVEEKVEEEKVEEKVEEEKVEEEKVEEKVEVIHHENSAGETVEVEIHRHDPRSSDEESTLELDEEDAAAEGEGTDAPQTNFEEWVHDGYSMKWNKLTNELLDPDDDEILGRIEYDEDGNPSAVIECDSDSDDD